MRDGLDRNTAVRRVHDQLVYGCDDAQCKSPACYTYQLRNSPTPARRRTSPSAMSTAFALINNADYQRYICSGKIKTPTASMLKEKIKVDDSSLEQALFATVMANSDQFTEPRVPQGQELPPKLRKPLKSFLTEQQLKDPMDAAKEWYLKSKMDKVETPCSPRHLSCKTSLNYQATFFRALCFVRMQEAVALPDLLHNYIEGSKAHVYFHKAISDYIQYQ